MLIEALKSGEGDLAENARLHHGIRLWVESILISLSTMGQPRNATRLFEEDLQQLLEDILEKLVCSLVELKCVPDCHEICEEHVATLGHPQENVKNMQQAVQALWIQRQQVSKLEFENMKPERRAAWLSNGSILLRPY
jgi:hypothetical protein